MTLLVIAAVAFVAVHAVPGTGLRARLVDTLGEGGYLGAFSLVSGVILVLIILGYSQAIAGPPWWLVGETWRWINAVLMLVAFVLVAAGGARDNPAGVGTTAVGGAAGPRGIYTITRHPMMVGIALWALLHLIANPDPPSWVMFGAFLITASLAFVLQDRRKAGSVKGWADYASRTSIAPFAAALAGRTRIDWAGIGWMRPLGAAIVWALALGAHPYVFGLPALPM